jgi:hypothetical protein
MKAATRGSQFENNINDTLVLITSLIGRYERETRLFSSNPRVSEAISQLYNEISKFLIQINLYFSKPRGFGSRVIVLRPKIKKTQVKVKVLADLLDQEIKIALEEREYQGQLHTASRRICLTYRQLKLIGPRAKDDSKFDVEADTRTLSNSGRLNINARLCRADLSVRQRRIR